jgi:ketosteroid isomerase-like protein
MTEFMDRLAIREQIDNYIDALNHRDWERFGATLCEDLVWSCSEPTAMRRESRKAMLDMVTTIQQYQFGFVFQMGHGLVVRELKGNQAKTCHTLQVFGDSFTSTGLYYDELRKESDGVWRFKRRNYQITYYEESKVPGKIYRQLPDPNYKELPGP